MRHKESRGRKGREGLLFVLYEAEKNELINRSGNLIASDSM